MYQGSPTSALSRHNVSDMKGVDSVYQGSNFGVSRCEVRCIRDASLGVSRETHSVYQGSPSVVRYWNRYFFPTYPHPLTRARDLNLKTNSLNVTPKRRLKRGLRPLGASNPPNPPYPQTDRPTGEPKLSNPIAARRPWRRKINPDYGSTTG